MRIVADKNIYFVAEAFANLGNLQMVNWQNLTGDDLLGADVLLVRSVTQVNEKLIGASNVKFVGSVTSGIDHIDIDYLKQRGIAFCHTAGSNAQAVAEYVVTALLKLAGDNDLALASKTLGIVGYGRIGKRLAKLVAALGINVLINDPPLQESGKCSEVEFVELEQLLQQSDIVSLHVPMLMQGEHCTYHLLNEKRLQQLKEGAWLINTARGAVVDNLALLNAIDSKGLKTVIDVWEHEPLLNTELLSIVNLATPHIAGYSLEAKYNATAQIYNDIADYFQIDKRQLQSLDDELHTIDLSAVDESQAVTIAVQRVYGIERDDENFKKMPQRSPTGQAEYFAKLRSDYPLRREFAAFKATGVKTAKISECLLGLGFSLF